MNPVTLKTAKALEKQINVIDTFISESCLDVEYTGMHYYIKVYMDNILDNCGMLVIK